ncbi:MULTISPECIES: ABC transporter permease [unclassified Sulfitobacter]|uniref:ABC transporter permease n=1 Tax=unclassified Sulfitobacter TaxID=196795 RepID=UPI0007C23613|nr:MULTISPECIES: ABC transporter permease [unclassified Sulfitobacter]KZY05508.1 peptide ABC transporter permease [Sulfitobacter sp. HI0023]KZY22538.1 peptide ABC transporter permease [Sulfitobacter sp. HI0040]KZZ70051.1 peptide ABC transporter permease [Sulfitobacter sp. HI0129]
MRALPANFILGAVLVSIVVGIAALSLVWTPWDPTALNIRNKFADPSDAHWLGTDQLGRDVVSQLMAAARNSMAVALIAVLAGGAIGVSLGLLASALGGWVEDIVMRLADLGFAFPALLFAIMLAAVFGPSLTNAVMAIAFINIPVFARVTRASANQIWTRDYVAAAQAAGLSRFAISRDHILPNIGAAVIVQATIEFAVAILAEAALSYLGLGAQPPASSWGRMLAEAQTLMYLAPQLAIYPGLCIVVAVLGFGLLGDGLRDITDPRLSRARAA